MKIAIVGTKGINAKNNGGGVEISVREMATRLADKGHEVIIYCRNDKDCPSENLAGNVQLIYLPSINSKHFGTLLHILFSSILVLFSNADVVHFQSLGAAPFCFLPRLFFKKSVITIHALDWQRKKWGFVVRLLLKLCEYPAMFLPNRTLVVSNTLKDYFEQKFKKKVYYIPNGISLQPVLKPVDAVKNNNKYILFVGRLVPEKGVHYLIKAFNELKTDFKLVIAGNPSFTMRYYQFLRSISNKNVEFVGLLEGEELKKLYRNAFLFVLPSEVEGASLSLLEAMSYGKCVLTSDIPACTEMVGENGIYFKTGDSLDLKHKLEYVIDNPTIAQTKGMLLRDAVSKRYNWDKIIEKIENAYV